MMTEPQAKLVATSAKAPAIERERELAIERKSPLFERISWRDPVTREPLEAIVTSRTPAGVPMSGALKRLGSSVAYPIVDCVVRFTPELAHRHREWLVPLGLVPPPSAAAGEELQAVETVNSFGWQWMWAHTMRSEHDLEWRVASRFGVTSATFAGGIALDAGAGAGDQTRYLSRYSAGVVSVDLSEAIDLVASKMRMESQWVGVQGDVTSLPFADGQFDIVYCEGVIQHTRDSPGTVRELVRVAKPGAIILASHYVRRETTSVARRIFQKLSLTHYNFLRDRLSRMERYRLLLVTGVLAALSYVPLLGRFVRWSGTAMYSDLMPDLKTTWTNTFDKYGNHSYQRFIGIEEFWSFFERLGTVSMQLKDVGVVTARKLEAPAAGT